MRAIIQQSKTLYAREHMAPESLELLLFLYCDKDLWNYAAIIDEAIAVAWEAKKMLLLLLLLLRLLPPPLTLRRKTMKMMTMKILFNY